MKKSEVIDKKELLEILEKELSVYEETKFPSKPAELLDFGARFALEQFKKKLEAL